MQSGTGSSKVSAKEWFIAMHPWSLTASIIPVCFGASMAALSGQWSTPLFILTLLGGIALHLGTNLHNTYGDYVSGVDTLESAVTCPQLVTGQISPKAMYIAGWLAFGAAALIGLVILTICGLWVLPFGIVGVLGGYYYTNGKNPYKYAGLGPYFVFLLMGPLMALPAYCIISGSFDAAPILGSLSIACLVAAIMHANDMRDIGHDRAAGIRTIAMRQGLKKSIIIYAALNLGAFILLGLNVWFGVLPRTALVAFLLLPFLLYELYLLAAKKLEIGTLEGWTAQFHMKFGLSLSAGVALALVF